MISNVEFQRLLNLLKEFVNTERLMLPKAGTKIDLKLSSLDKKEDFVLNIRRGRINLSKITYQNLYSKYNMPLIRIDLDGTRHQNPDGEFVGLPHIHIYKEGFGDKWAYELDKELFTNTDDLALLLEQFMDYCNIKQVPIIHQIDMGI